MIVIDKLAYSSALRYKSPLLKTVFSVGSLFICVAARSFVISLSILFVMGGLTLRYSRTSLLRYCKLMMVPLAFLLLSTVAIMVNWSLVPLDLWNLPLGDYYLSVSSASLLQGGRLVLTALSAVSCLYFLTLTTPMMDFLMVLRRLYCPWILLELMLLIYRYIFVLLDMASAMVTAQKCRLGNRDFKTSLRSMGQILAVLLVRALQKSSRLYDSMESRLYDGQIRVLSVSCKAERWETLAVAAFLTVLGIAAVGLRIFGGGL